MRQRLVGFGGWVVAALALVTAGVTAAAQSGPPKDGAFVAGSDGSVWVVANGMRFGIAPASDPDNQVAGLPEGPKVASLGELNAAITAAAPAAPASASMPMLDYTFTDRGQSPGFRAEGRVDVCWEFSPAGMGGSMTLNPEGSRFWVDDGFFNGISRTGCRTIALAPGDYYINVSILQTTRGQTTSLHVTVRPAP